MENAKCECTDEKESCDLESILKQQLGEYPECNCPGSTEIIGAKHLHCIIVISIKATDEKFVFQESQKQKNWISSVCVAKCDPRGENSGTSTARNTRQCFYNVLILYLFE